jgi:hypothetical protein
MWVVDDGGELGRLLCSRHAVATWRRNAITSVSRTGLGLTKPSKTFFFGQFINLFLLLFVLAILPELGESADA